MKQAIDPNLTLEQFDFELPSDLIAQIPMLPRDAARMLVVDRDKLEDRGVMALAEYLEKGDLLIFNDTKVIPARLIGKRRQAKIEVTLHKRDATDTWRAFARPARKLKEQDIIDFAEGFSATVEEKGEAGEVSLKFDRGGEALMAALEAHGGMPLPPYIKRDGLADGADKSDYQTVFAKEKGAVAAPTAGLHFTPRLIETLDDKGVEGATVTLHVGAGTFLPVKVDNVSEHKMHAEWGCVSQETVDLIRKTKAAGKKVIAVGTTSMRLLEAATDGEGEIHPFEGETDIFITPGYKFGVIDKLLTNFHLPKSTLFMLVSAFAGTARMKKAYAHAIANDYRFFSYGDCCLLTRENE